MISFEELRSKKVIVLDPNRKGTHRWLDRYLSVLGNNAMTARELADATGNKKTPASLRYYEKAGHIKAIAIEGKNDIYYTKIEAKP